jgi:hypothetical protein
VSDRMASYWIVVPRENADLFELLSIAFRGRSGFHVILDRRTVSGAPDADRRGPAPGLGRDEIVVAEQADQSSRVMELPAPAVRHRIPVRRSRPRRPAADRLSA